MRNPNLATPSRSTSSSSPLLEELGKRFYQFTAIDDCTRLRVLRALSKVRQF